MMGSSIQAQMLKFCSATNHCVAWDKLLGLSEPHILHLKSQTISLKRWSMEGHGLPHQNHVGSLFKIATHSPTPS